MKRALLIVAFFGGGAWAQTCQITSPLPVPVTLTGCTYSGSLPANSTSYIQNTLSPTTTGQMFSVQVGTFSNAMNLGYLDGTSQCLQTDGNGNVLGTGVTCGSGGGGGGSFSLAITTGGPNAFSGTAISSSNSTTEILFDSATTNGQLLTGTTYLFTLNPSSVTLQGNGPFPASLLTNLTLISSAIAFGSFSGTVTSDSSTLTWLDAKQIFSVGNGSGTMQLQIFGSTQTPQTTSLYITGQAGTGNDWTSDQDWFWGNSSTAKVARIEAFDPWTVNPGHIRLRLIGSQNGSSWQTPGLTLMEPSHLQSSPGNWVGINNDTPTGILDVDDWFDAAYTNEILSLRNAASSPNQGNYIGAYNNTGVSQFSVNHGGMISSLGGINTTTATLTAFNATQTSATITGSGGLTVINNASIAGDTSGAGLGDGGTGNFANNVFINQNNGGLWLQAYNSFATGLHTNTGSDLYLRTNTTDNFQMAAGGAITLVSSTTNTSAGGVSITYGLKGSTETLVNSTTPTTLCVSTSATPPCQLQVSSAVAVAPTDYLLTVSSPSGTMVFGLQNSGHIISSGTVPTIGSCGTTPTMNTGSTDYTGAFTWGGIANSCVLTFANSYVSAPFCIGSSTGPYVGVALPGSATSVTFNISGLVGSTVTYHCDGGRGG